MQNKLSIIDIVALGQTKIVEEMLAQGEDINEADPFGNTPVLLSCHLNNLNMLKLLIKHEAKLDVQDNLGRTPLSWATKHNNADMIKMIEEALSLQKSFGPAQG